MMVGPVLFLADGSKRVVRDQWRGMHPRREDQGWTGYSFFEEKVKSVVMSPEDGQLGRSEVVGYRRGGPRERAIAVSSAAYAPPSMPPELPQMSCGDAVLFGDQGHGEGSSASQKVIRPKFKAAPSRLTSRASSNPATQRYLRQLRMQGAIGSWPEVATCGEGECAWRVRLRSD